MSQSQPLPTRYGEEIQDEELVNTLTSLEQRKIISVVNLVE